jgi:hypothetical protein
MLQGRAKKTCPKALSDSLYLSGKILEVDPDSKQSFANLEFAIQIRQIRKWSLGKDVAWCI